MGLGLEVGYLVVLLDNDEEGAELFKSELERLNTFLVSNNLQPHSEPKECKVFTCDMYGYSGLHYLRRIAAHLDLKSALPDPGNSDVATDPVMAEYYLGHQGEQNASFVKRAPNRTFDHLMLHSDAEGYYLPQDFELVLSPPESLSIAGGMVGSANRLLAECKRLAAALELPHDLDHESDEVWDASNSQGQGVTKWQRYGIESYTCLRLIRACERSIEVGAAIVFC
jgi:hypothetical protein